jgi:hypothetical protein
MNLFVESPRVLAHETLASRKGQNRRVKKTEMVKNRNGSKIERVTTTETVTLGRVAKRNGYIGKGSK